MKIGIIVCEYNPLHLGHLWHIGQTKSILGVDHLVCVMSGSIVQRGEIAVVDKFTRAKWAIQAGADMVVEIPAEFCLGSAEIYASGAIGVANCISGNKSLSFGSECGDINQLRQVADIIGSPIVQNGIKTNTKSGITYAKSLSLALTDYCNNNNLGHLANIIDSPNNTLAIEYLRAIGRNNLDIDAFTITRQGGGYNDLSCDHIYPSASAIRHRLYNNLSIKDTVPDFVHNDIGNISNIDNALFSLLKFELNNKDISNILGANEGLHNLIKKHLMNAHSYNDLLDLCCSKRYNYATIKRFLLACLVDLESSFQQLQTLNPTYLNILAVKQSKIDILSLINIPCVTKPADYSKKQIIVSNTQQKADLLFQSLRYSYKNYMQIID